MVSTITTVIRIVARATERRPPVSIVKPHRIVFSFHGEVDTSDLESRTARRSLTYGDPPTVSRNDLFDDSQSEARTSRRGRIAAFEHLLTLPVGNPWSVIFDEEPAPLFEFPHRDRHMLITMFDSVSEQILEDLG